MRSPSRMAPLVLVCALAATACSSAARTASPSAAPTTTSPATTPPATASGSAAGTSTSTATAPTTQDTSATTVGESTVSAAPSTTEPTSPLGDPTQCPLGALDTASGTTTITFWHEHGNVPGEVIKALVDQFNTENPKIHVNAEFQDDLATKYITTLAAGDKPDVVSLQTSNNQLMIDTKSTVPFGACVVADHADLSDELKPILALGMSGGQLVTLPWGQGGNVLYYNKAAFIKAGLDPAKPPTTFDEIRADSKAIVSSGAAKHGIALTVNGGILSEQFGLLNQPWGATPDSAGRATKINGDGTLAIAIATTLRDMVDTGELLPFADGPSPNALLSLASDDAAMTFASSGSLGDVVKALDGGVGSAAGLTTDTLGVAILPSFTARVSSFYSGSGKGIWLVDNGDPAKLEASYRFAKWLNEAPQIAAWSMKTGYIATRASAAALPAMQDYWTANPLFKVGYDQAANPPYTPDPSASIGPTDQAASEFDAAMLSIVTKGADPAQTLGDATKKANADIAAYSTRFPAR